MGPPALETWCGASASPDPSGSREIPAGTSLSAAPGSTPTEAGTANTFAWRWFLACSHASRSEACRRRTVKVWRANSCFTVDSRDARKRRTTPSALLFPRKRGILEAGEVVPVSISSVWASSVAWPSYLGNVTAARRYTVTTRFKSVLELHSTESGIRTAALSFASAIRGGERF